MSKPTVNIIQTLRAAIMAAPGGKENLDHLMDVMGRRSFGVLLLILAVPSMLPVPGLVSLFGAVLLLLGVQMLLGFQQPWLPTRVRHAVLPKKQLLHILGFLKKPVNLLTPYIHRRLPGLVRHYGENLAGLMVIIQAIFIIIPLPFTNEPPALSLIVLALAFIQQDGLLAILSYLLGGLGIALMLSIYGGLIMGAYTAWLAWL